MMLRRHRIYIVLPLLVSLLAMPVFASEPDPLFDEAFEEESSGYPDPFERVNRPTLAFNRVLDRFVLNPLTLLYGFILPGPVKQSIRQAFDNAHAPPIIMNDLFQREWRDAGVTTARFVVNSTIGVGGLFDPATAMGLPQHYSDFGQTLALLGVGSGPYMIIPIIGPSTLRNATGFVVDSLMSPTIYLLGPGELLFYYTLGGRGLVKREAHMREIAALEAGAVDYYAVLRDAYYQSRNAEIWERREHHRAPALADSVHVPAGELRDAGIDGFEQLVEALALEHR
jgi:phospholipid-binding lipoprotein MlaA